MYLGRADLKLRFLIVGGKPPCVGEIATPDTFNDCFSYIITKSLLCIFVMQIFNVIKLKSSDRNVSRTITLLKRVDDNIEDYVLAQSIHDIVFFLMKSDSNFNFTNFSVYLSLTLISTS